MKKMFKALICRLLHKNHWDVSGAVVFPHRTWGTTDCRKCGCHLAKHVIGVSETGFR